MLSIASGNGGNCVQPIDCCAVYLLLPRTIRTFMCTPLILLYLLAAPLSEIVPVFCGFTPQSLLNPPNTCPDHETILSFLTRYYVLGGTHVQLACLSAGSRILHSLVMIAGARAFILRPIKDAVCLTLFLCVVDNL